VLGKLNAQHITTAKLEAALQDVIDEYSRFRLPLFWGKPNVAVADRTHYELHENNLLGGRHIRYGGYGGIAYHHISDTYVALFSHFIACGMWEAVYILDGLLKNKAVLQPDTVHADTQGQSEVVFGLAHLLGIQLMPRMRNWNKVTMYRPSKTSRYQNIDGWFTRTINWELLHEHWQDLMQVDDMAGLARVAWRQGKLAQAAAHVQEALTWLEENGSQGIEYPLRVYLTAYEVLRANSQEKAAQQALRQGHQMMMEQMAQIGDEAAQQVFLSEVPVHKQLCHYFAELEGTN
jgi:hypothetical protein